MDTITHLALGACIGETMLGKKAGKRALLWGAMAQSVPDVDFIAGFFLDPASNLLFHRGITHSILFAVLITPVLSWPAYKVHKKREGIKYREWLLFFLVQVLVHDLLDGFNAYGTSWFMPFNDTKYSFDVLFVADPLFSIWLAVAMVALFVFKPVYKNRKYWLRFGMLLPAIYFLYALFNKYSIHTETKAELIRQNINYDDYFTTPVYFNNFLWYVVVSADSAYYVGYRSVFDRNKTIEFAYIPKNKHLLEQVKDRDDVSKLVKFARGYHTMEMWHDTLVFNNLRFGQVPGAWESPRTDFAFHYFVGDDFAGNLMVVQRGRFQGWNRETFSSLWRRIRGK